MGVRTRFFRMFIKRQETSGFFLMFTALAAIIWANSPWQAEYISLWEKYISVSFGTLKAGMSLRHFVDDVLMAVFFLMVGCELKRECVEGELSSPAHIKLPIIAAMGGMIAPALIFMIVNLVLPSGERSFMHGWAIPTATDIAFALGVLAMMKSYVPPSLKAFLVALAIIDDLGAVLLIGLFYTSDLNLAAMAGAGLCMIGLWSMNRKGIHFILPYAVLGAFLWYAIYKSGIHATLSGVILALFMPMRAEARKSLNKYVIVSPLKTIEHKLHLWVAYFIIPVFALANAGVVLKGLSFDMMLSPLTFGIIAGLFFGKQIGVFGATWLSVKFKFAALPSGVKWHHMYAASLLCGIGFTMSLFISCLAFNDQEALMSARLGVLSASTMAALAGSLIFYMFGKKKVAKATGAVLHAKGVSQAA